MKKLLINITWLIILSGSIYTCMMVALCKVDIGDSRGIYYAANYIPRKGGQELHSFNSFDADSSYSVLILGSSRAYRGYDPRIFTSEGISCFNFGTSAQNTLVANHLLDRYIPLRTGQTVVLDIYPSMFEESGMESILRMIIHEPSSKYSAELSLKSGDLRSLNTWAKRMITLNEEDEYWTGGHEGSGYINQPDTLREIVQLPQPFVPNEKFFHCLNELVDKVHASGAELVFVSHPMPEIEGYQDRHEEFLRYLQPIVDDFELLYLDYTFSLDLSFDHFADENHLNHSGVEIFNPALIEDLRTHNILD